MKTNTFYLLGIGAAVATALFLVLEFVASSATVVGTTGSMPPSSPYSPSGLSRHGSARTACRWPSARQQLHPGRGPPSSH